MQLEAREAGQLASVVMKCLETQYPHKLDHVLESDSDLVPPSRLHPVFYGSYDWHSSVHNFWSLARLLREDLPVKLNQDVRTFISGRLTERNVLSELSYFERPAQVAAERPYGWAWLVYLCADLASSADSDLQNWHGALMPLAEFMWSGLRDYIDNLPAPILGGSYNSTAFTLSLMVRSVDRLGSDDDFDWLRAKTFDWFVDVTESPINNARYGDFLPFDLIVGDLISMTQPSTVLSNWLDEQEGLLKNLELDHMEKADSSDPDGVHAYGIHLGRAWTLYGISGGLDSSDARKKTLRQKADNELARGSKVISTGNFLSDHWLPTFALYARLRSSENQG